MDEQFIVGYTKKWRREVNFVNLYIFGKMRPSSEVAKKKNVYGFSPERTVGITSAFSSHTEKAIVWEEKIIK